MSAEGLPPARPWWRRSSGDRTLALVAGVALATLLLGLVLGRSVVSPAEAAERAAPPDAGPITVPVETRVISNDVTLRGDARYDDPQPITVEPGDREGPAVVTGAVPAVGAALDAASVALEVTGRPLVVLPGELPVYRTLRPGSTGPDVVQLKQALWALGIATGSPDRDVYDAEVAAGVAALYSRVGYGAPAPEEGATEAVPAAEREVAAAQAGVATARAALEAVRAGPSKAARMEQDNLVRAAERELGAAQAAGDPLAVAAATDALALARAQREAALAAPATTEQAAALTGAEAQLAEARRALAAAREAVLTTLPASEVVYLPSLPRRVDQVSVQRGSVVDGPVMQVSGAELEVVASAAPADAALLSVGTAATFPAPDGSEVRAAVASVEAATPGGGGGAEGGGGGEGEEPGPAAAGRMTVTFVPEALTDAQLTGLQGTNVRLSVPVESTGGEVLAVPVAALTAGPGGETRVELAQEGGGTELVEVTTGLAAEGYAQITDGDLEAGDLVVVGR